MDKKVILFNGPPSSGKDTAVGIAKHLLHNRFAVGGMIAFKPRPIKMADPLKEAAHALFGLPYSCEYYEKEFGNEWKDKPCIEFFGDTPRSVYISLSEEYAKKGPGGEGHFGRIAARRIGLDKEHNVFLFSDAGFAREAIPIISVVGVENVLVVEMARDGCSFAGDSRGYVGNSLNLIFANKVSIQKMPNDHDKAILRVLIEGALKTWLDLEER